MLGLYATDVVRAAPNTALAVGLILAVTLVALRQFLTLHELDRSRSDLAALNERLQESMSAEHHLARTDALTGIPNRRLLAETIEAEIGRASRYGQTLSVLMVDVDNLKQINDTYSHQSGDEALQLIGRVARATCRQADLVGRYGGDEFTFVLPSTEQGNAAVLAERFRDGLVRDPANRFGLTVSVGVAEWDRDAMVESADLLAAADSALYAAKAAGKNRTVTAPREPASSVA
jgi:diguanylate cyclase (GGDEF)-like protein